MEKISFVIPVYNEDENIHKLFEEIDAVANTLEYDHEIIFVDDYSNDQSLSIMKSLSKQNSKVKFISLTDHFGQSTALYAGFQHATGDIIITMDADLQNDPADIPLMLKYYGEFEMVTGWRFNRQDTLWKKFGGKVGNLVRNWLTHETIHDTGCSLKVMKAEMVKMIKMYRGLHRFLPTLMKLEGARVMEIKVHHRPRLHGVSKYTNIQRAVEGLYDVIAVRWMVRRHLKIMIKESNV